MSEPRRVRRRDLLTGGAAATVGAGVAIGTGSLRDTSQSPRSGVGRATPTMYPFNGRHQAGVTTPPQQFAALVAYDLRDGNDRDSLRRLMRIWTDDIDRLTHGEAALSDTEPELARHPAGLTVTVGYGSGFFTAAGLEERRPSWLRPLPAFQVDRLRVDWSHGDLVVQVCADDQLTVAHTVRLLTKDARTFCTTRWRQSGFRGPAGGGHASTRNLMGQVDGTRNPTAGRLVWCGDDSGWLRDGTSMVVRRIAMHLDTWDELDHTAREQVIGRRLSNGAPLTGAHEHDEPDLDAVDDDGLPVIASFAHIRRARTGQPTQRFLRRPYNYDEAPTGGRSTDTGLIFVTYQADVDLQFVPVQRRLDDSDLLNRWTTPIGSAVFAVPPGCRRGSYLGAPLVG